MTPVLTTPLDDTFGRLWSAIPPVYKKAWVALTLLHLMAFGFEMTNLTLHHDDLAQIFIQDTILGHYLGRFGTGWLHYYTQGAYFMPFWQMAQAIVMMSLYALIVGHLWGLRRAFDLIMVGGLMVVFPYMAHVYQYNTTMATYTVAHVLAALSIYLSVKARVLSVVLAAVCLFFAFSIYQSVANNAAAIFLVWLLLRWIDPSSEAREENRLWRPTLATALAGLTGGLAYVGVVKTMDIPFDAYQGAGEAFDLGRGLDIHAAVSALVHGSRAFYLWPEHYLPMSMKGLQLILLLGGLLACLWIPRKATDKSVAAALYLLILFSPRLLQALHPHGHYHQLTLTAYAVVIAGAATLLLRIPLVWIGNGTRLVTTFLIIGYLIQCNWISTVNFLNTQAHFYNFGQIMARVRSLPPESWDGQTIVVVGRYEMSGEHPYRPATGVASRFLDAEHMDYMARLLRDPIRVVAAAGRYAWAREYAEHRPVWPAGGSIFPMNHVAVVILSPPKP